MIVLAATTETLIANTAIAADPAVTSFSSFRIRTSTTFTPDNAFAEITDTPAATIVPAPSGAGVSHIIDQITIHNEDNVSHTVTVQWSDTSQFATLWQGTLTAGQTLYYNEGAGWSLSA